MASSLSTTRSLRLGFDARRTLCVAATPNLQQQGWARAQRLSALRVTARDCAERLASEPLGGQGCQPKPLGHQKAAQRGVAGAGPTTSEQVLKKYARPRQGTPSNQAAGLTLAQQRQRGHHPHPHTLTSSPPTHTHTPEVRHLLGGEPLLQGLQLLQVVGRRLAHAAAVPPAPPRLLRGQRGGRRRALLPTYCCRWPRLADCREPYQSTST